jgi:signal transduction histidine kinase
VLLAAAALFVAVVILGELNGQTELLYVVPVTLVSLELGLTAGLVCAAVAAGALALSVGGIELAAGAAAFVSVGAVAGRFGDRMRDAQRRQQRLLSSGVALAHLEAAGKLPEMLARRALELTGAQAARVELVSGEVGQAGAGASSEGVRIPIALRDVRYGSLQVYRSRPLVPEDRASLEILALQTAVAIESRRLLERRAQVHELISRHEAERHHVAHELHDEAAQVLAAALLSLGALERELGASRSGPRLGELRSDIDSTLRSLRSLAASLRPQALQLGLRAALEELAADARARDYGEVTVALDGVDGLSPDAETMVYRVVEEALDAVGSAQSASVERRAGDDQIVIEIHGARSPVDPARLAVLRARMELAGGTLADEPAGLRAVIPVLSASSGARPTPVVALPAATG